jgi:hypothetical protein
MCRNRIAYEMPEYHISKIMIADNRNFSFCQIVYVATKEVHSGKLLASLIIVWLKTTTSCSASQHEIAFYEI